MKDVSAADLAATVIRTLIERGELDLTLVEDVILVQWHPNGEVPAIESVAALNAGIPVEEPSSRVDRRCGSGLQAVIYVVVQIQTGAADLLLAGGAESMSQGEFYSTEIRGGTQWDSLTLVDRLARARVTAGNSSGRNDDDARCIVTTRERADALSLEPFARLVSWSVSGVPPSMRTRTGAVHLRHSGARWTHAR